VRRSYDVSGDQLTMRFYFPVTRKEITAYCMQWGAKGLLAISPAEAGFTSSASIENLPRFGHAVAPRPDVVLALAFDASGREFRHSSIVPRRAALLRLRLGAARGGLLAQPRRFMDR